MKVKIQVTGIHVDIMKDNREMLRAVAANNNGTANDDDNIWQPRSCARLFLERAVHHIEMLQKFWLLQTCISKDTLPTSDEFPYSNAR